MGFVLTTRYLFPFLLLLGLACFPAIRAQGMSDTVLRVPDPYADFQPVEIVESREDSLAILQQWQAGQMAAALDEMWEYRRQFLYESFDVKELHYKHSGPVVEGNDTVWLPLPGPGSPYVQPFRGRISSRFGFRWGRMHYGTDIALRTGDTVRAAFDGVVRIAQRNASYGYIVILFHRNGLETYYEAHKNEYMKPGKAVAMVFVFDEGLKAAKVGKMVATADKEGWTEQEAKAAFNKKFGDWNVLVDSAVYGHGENAFVDKVEWKTGLSEVVENDEGRRAFVLFKEIIPEAPAPLDEVRGLVVSDYQGYLEKEWVKELRSRYPVRIFQDVCESIFQK